MGGVGEMLGERSVELGWVIGGLIRRPGGRLGGPRGPRVGKGGRGLRAQLAGRGTQVGATGPKRRARQRPWQTHGGTYRSRIRRRSLRRLSLRSPSALQQCSLPLPSHRT